MAKQLREYRVSFDRAAPNTAPVNRRAYGLRSKLGGTPDWEQGDETPLCSHCSEPMTFVAQIDSIEQQSKDNPHSVDALSPDQHYMFGDVGLIYVFFCNQCLESASVFQCG